MRLHKSESVVRDLFAKAQIEVNGTQPYDLQVNDERTDHVLSILICAIS